MPVFQTDPQESSLFHLQPAPGRVLGRVIVRDDNHSIQLVTYRNGHQPVSVPVTPLHALTIASELSNAATRALYRARADLVNSDEIPHRPPGVTITMRVKSYIARLHRKFTPRRFAG